MSDNSIVSNESNESNELERLLDMAEKISDTVGKLNATIINTATRLIFLGVILIILVLGISLFWARSGWHQTLPMLSYYAVTILAMLTVVFLTYLFFRIAIQLKSLKKSKRYESEILQKLLEMIFEFKDNLQKDNLSNVDKAILEIKLKRMQFSSAA